MKISLLFVVAFTCCAQNVSNLSAEIQRAPSAALYAERAAAFLAAGDARGALADTDRALDKDALNVRALVLRAQANSKLGRFSAAVTDLSGAIALAPTDASLYVARSEAYASVGDQPRALADRNEALHLDPSIVVDRKPAAAPAPQQVAVVAPPPAREPTVITPPPPAPKQQPAKAPLATSPAVVIAPPAENASADAHYQRAKALINDRKFAEAVAEMNESVKAQPKNAVYLNTRGYARYLAKDIKGAVQDYDEAIKLNPDYLNATHNRSVARRAAGDIAGAEADRKREVELTQKQAGK